MIWYFLILKLKIIRPRSNLSLGSESTRIYLSGFAHFCAHCYASSAIPSPACLSVCKALAPKGLCTLYQPSKIMILLHSSWSRLYIFLVSLFLALFAICVEKIILTTRLLVKIHKTQDLLYIIYFFNEMTLLGFIIFKTLCNCIWHFRLSIMRNNCKN